VETLTSPTAARRKPLVSNSLYSERDFTLQLLIAN